MESTTQTINKILLENMQKVAVELFVQYKSGQNWINIDKSHKNLFVLGFEACALKYFFSKKAKITTCEDHSVNPTEYGISFDGFNPESKDYFKMTDVETAVRLANYLNQLYLKI